MSTIPASFDHDDLPGDDAPKPEAERGDNRRPSGGPAWLISASVHALFAMIFWAVVFAGREVPVEMPPIKITMPDAEKVKPPTEPKVAPIDPTPDLKVDEDVTVAPIDPVVVTEEKPSSEDDNFNPTPKGVETEVANAEMGGTGAFPAIGAASGASGMFGLRNGGNRHRAAVRGGGSQQSEVKVENSLNWFTRHQSANGMWDVERYQLNCSDGQKCEPGSTGESGGSDANVAMTGYALLCYLGAGYDHKSPNKYRRTVQKAIDYLRSVQKPDGLLGNRNYEHAVATMALAEAYAMTSDLELKGPAQKGISLIVARQNKDAKAADAQYAGLGWDYVEPKPERNDSSVSGWNVMALKSGLAAGLNVGNGMEGAKKWVERAWKASNKDWAKISDPYSSLSSFPYTWDATNDQVQIDPPGSQNHDLASVGAVCGLFLGHHAGDLMVESLCNNIEKYQFPTTYPCNTYYLYYNTMAIFQSGTTRWNKWNIPMRDMLVKAQRTGDGCYNGSWDWEGTKFHGNAHGRILSTAYCCLCLEVYYRYVRSNEDTTAGQAKAH